jgi:hypothetical protein
MPKFSNAGKGIEERFAADGFLQIGDRALPQASILTILYRHNVNRNVACIGIMLEI